MKKPPYADFLTPGCVNNVETTKDAWLTALMPALATVGLKTKLQASRHYTVVTYLTVTDPAAPTQIIMEYAECSIQFRVKETRVTTPGAPGAPHKVQRFAAIELLCPSGEGQRMLRVSKLTDANVAKVVAHVRKYISVRIACRVAADARSRRNAAGVEISKDAFKGFVKPAWCEVRPSVASDDAIGKFSIYFNQQHAEFPRQLTPQQVMDAIAVLSGQAPKASGWRPVSEPVPPELISHGSRIVYLLLYCPNAVSAPIVGFRYPDQWVLDGWPKREVTHWMPILDRP